LVVILGLKKNRQAKPKPSPSLISDAPLPLSRGSILRPLFSQGVVAILFFFVLGILFTFLPLLATQVAGVSATRVGILFTISGLVAMVLSIPMAMLADRKGKKVLMIAGLFISSLAMAGLAFSESYLWLVIFATLVSFGMAMFEPASLGLIASVVSHRRLSTAMGLYGGVFENTGIIAGSALAGVVWSALGPQATFLIGTITGGLGIITCLGFVKENKGKLPVY
jgi:MFS family permease